MLNLLVYVYIYIYTHTHTYIYIWQITAFFSEIRTKYINTLFGQNAEFFNVKPVGMYIYIYIYTYIHIHIYGK